jgi:hypothetical protein
MIIRMIIRMILSPQPEDDNKPVYILEVVMRMIIRPQPEDDNMQEYAEEEILFIHEGVTACGGVNLGMGSARRVQSRFRTVHQPRAICASQTNKPASSEAPTSEAALLFI